MLVSPEHFLRGAVAGRLQARHVGQGADLPAGWVEIPGRAVTAANVDELVARDATPANRTAWYTTRLDEVLGGLRVRPMGEAQ